MPVRKTLRELTIKNNFMFDAVMCEGKAEDVIELLEEVGIISGEVREKIMAEKNWKH